jgi:hypothetical protein
MCDLNMLGTRIEDQFHFSKPRCDNYCHVCRAGEADDDLFFIQFLLIYLADTARAWLDHFP